MVVFNRQMNLQYLLYGMKEQSCRSRAPRAHAMKLEVHDEGATEDVEGMDVGIT